MRSVRKVALFTIVWLAAIVAAAVAEDVPVDPLQCWWRTTAGAVRVGETFRVVLTCAVLETEAVTVVVDQSRLEPSVLQFPPFEVLGGAHGADLRSGHRRFFQYEYRLRLVAENLFGKDVALPDVKLSYRVQSRVGRNTALQGRDQTYVLPAQSVRVLSLVPSDASDIRDSGHETFDDLDRRSFRASLFVVVGGVLFVLAGLLALLGARRLLLRFRKPTVVVDRLTSDVTILRGVGRELTSVQRQREDGHWTPALTSRALTALRVVAAYALDRRVVQLPAAADDPAENGGLHVKGGWPRAKRIRVSSSITSRAIASELARGADGFSASQRQLLDSLEQVLGTFTAATFGREEALDESALDRALSIGVQALRQARINQNWLVKKLAAWRTGAAVDRRAWSR